MAKVGFSIIYILMALLMISIISRIGKDTDDKGRIIKRQIPLYLIANFLYMFSFFFDNSVVLEKLHCGVLLAEVWLGVLFVQFGFTIAGYTSKFRRTIIVLAVLLAGADSCMILTELFGGNLYSFQMVEWNGTHYARVCLNNWYAFHFGLTLVLQLVTIGIVFVKALKVAKVLRQRYVTATLIMTGVLVVTEILRVVSSFLLYSALNYLAFVICIYFYMYYYIPQLRVMNMNSFVMKNMTSPILMFDCDNELQIFNPAAEELLPIRKFITINEFIADNNLRYILTEERKRQGKTKEFALTMAIGEMFFLIHGQELWDDKKRFVGTLLIYSDITNQERIKDEATYLATRDPLTGIWNRDYFFEMAQRTILDHPDVRFVMIASDISHFMMFNDILGKKAGDDLLLSITGSFEEKCKPRWVMGRISADRFAMILPKEDFVEQNFLKFTNKVFESRGYSLKVHLLMGVYEIVDAKMSPTSMYDRAYMAVESLKMAKRDGVAYYTDELREARRHETMTLDDMELALKEHEFIVYLQPQIDSQSGKVVGSEALVRWVSPRKGLVSPVEFIPLFESNGLISKLDYYIWEEVCKILRRWKDEGHDNRSISVNISAKDFYLTDLYHNIVNLVEKYEVNPKNLKLEITETAFVLDIREQSNLVNRFREYGFIIEIDDFGSGYSSLNSLKDIHVDVLKLDMKFLEKTQDTVRAEKIIESIIRLAYNLNILVIAEGVETQEQVEMLHRMGCDVIQGYYYAKPMSVEEFDEYINEHPYEGLTSILERILEQND